MIECLNNNIRICVSDVFEKWLNDLNDPSNLRTDYDRGFRDGAFAAKLKMENNI